MTRIPELEQELVAAAERLRSPRRVLRPAARVALAAAAVAVVAVLLVVEATDKDHGQKTGTPPSQSRAKTVINVRAGVRFSLEGRVLTVSLQGSAPAETRQRVNGARIRATCGKALADAPGGGPRQTRTRLWPTGRARLRFRFPRDISESARWCRLENTAVGIIAFARFPGASPGAMELVSEAADTWAREFASGPLNCMYMGQPACEQLGCQRVGAPRPIPNCTPPSRAFRRSFQGATVQEIAINGDRAAVRFSNGETVELRGGGDLWMIHKFGANAGHGFFEDTTAPPLSPEQKIEQTANQWAGLFATSDPDTCHLTMTQPACERAICTRNDPTDPPIRNCTLPSAEYRNSFRDASVEKIGIKGQRAAARFTNGEAVELFRPEVPPGDVWLVHKFGENAGRGFFEK